LLFAEWLTSLEGQQTFTEVSGGIVPDTRVTGPAADAVKGHKLALTLPELAANGSEAEAIGCDLFLE
jgi:hypothetical protein